MGRLIQHLRRFERWMGVKGGARPVLMFQKYQISHKSEAFQLRIYANENIPYVCYHHTDDRIPNVLPGNLQICFATDLLWNLVVEAINDENLII